MKIFGKKANSLKGEFSAYVEEMRKCLKAFESFFFAYSQGICGDHLTDLERDVRTAESACDDKRRAIQKMLTTGAFMPDFRSDIFHLTEAIDKVPNKAEEIVIFVSIACHPIPPNIADDFRAILDLTIKCTSDLADALDMVLTDLQASMQKAQIVEITESEIDTLERSVYRKIFHNNDLTPGSKMLLKKFVAGVCALSDKAEDASDRIELMAIKRKA